MSEKSATYDSELFKMDLKIFESAMKKKDFKTAIIMSNRIMSNAWVSDTQFYGIIGFFLRQLTMEALSSSNVNNSSAVDSMINQISIFTDNILAQVSSNKNNLKELWINFGIAIEKSRKETLPDAERDNYTTNIEYTNKTAQKVMELLFTSKDVLRYAYNNLIKGVLSEIFRVSKTYSISTPNLYLLSLLVMIDRIDEYVGMTTIDKKDFETRMEKEVIPYINQLEDVYANKMDEEKVNSLLWDLIKSWRVYYVRFMEPRRQAPQNQQPIIEGKIKDELVEELAEGIEKEVISE